MRRAIIGAIILVALISIPPVQAEITFQSGFHVDWWTSEGDDKGRQSHIPLIWEGEFDQFSFKVQTAQVFNFIDPDSLENRDVDGLADTQINLSYEIMDRWPVDLLFGMDINLPTGTTGLANIDLVYITDPDLVSITRMGQGLNLNPSITILKQWDRFMAAAGLGFLWRGKYNASDTLRGYDPGNVLNFTAEAVYTFYPKWTGRFFGGWTSYAADQWPDDDYYKPGDITILGGGVNYAKADWHIDGRMTWVLRDKESRESSGDIVTEDRNSFGDEWIAEISGGYSLTDRTDLGIDLRYLVVNANEYDPTDPNYASERTKTSIGCDAVHRWSATIETGLRLSIFTLSVEDNPDNYGEEDDYQGGSLTFWGAMRF